MNSNNDEPWYAVKSIFKHDANSSYEERIVIFKAQSFEEAEVLARQEAKSYVTDLDGVSFIKIIDTFHLFDKEVGPGTEVYSTVIESSDEPKSFIERRYKV